MSNRKHIIQHYLRAQFGRSTNKWKSLIHSSVKFPEEYVQKNIPILYDGTPIILSKESEEIAFMYAKYVGSEYVSNSTFNKNFFNDWKKILGKDHVIQQLSLCDFSLMKTYINESKSIVSPTNTNDDKYKIAIVNDKQQTITNYRLEPPGIFIGRGKNPQLGKLKKRVYPEDITINISKGVPIPTPLDGHKWGKIIHDRSVEWLSSWKDCITGKTKYLWLSAHSDMKTSNDHEKFDVARKLKKKIKSISETNSTNMSSDDIKLRQTATALYFIDKLAIRVGNEKSDDETDTVGITNLRVEHISLGDHTVTLNFLGKDSVPYTNTVYVDSQVFSNVSDFIKDKDKSEQVFDKITSSDINKYLQEFMSELTAKVFRTYNASNLFQKELTKITTKYSSEENKGDNIKQIMDEFIKANVKVAVMMNHQKNVSAGYKKNVDKINEHIKKLKATIKKSTDSKKQKLKQKMQNYKSKLSITKEMKNISLGTSKANYIDPRITVAFLKTHNLDVNKIFTKTLQEKFKWAFSVDNTFRF